MESENSVMTKIFGNYMETNDDFKQTKQDMYDNETTYTFCCAEINELSEEEENEDGLPYCDFEGEVDCYSESSSGQGWWDVKYIGECPKCGRGLVVSEGDSKR
jgi:hypothetical protein